MVKKSSRECTNSLLLVSLSKLHRATVIKENLVFKVSRVLLNRDRVGTFGSRPGDLFLPGDLVDNVNKLADALGWRKELDELREKYMANK